MNSPRRFAVARENRETVPAAKTVHLVADLVAQKTGGRFKIEVYPAGQLGTEAHSDVAACTLSVITHPREAPVFTLARSLDYLVKTFMIELSYLNTGH